MCDYPRHKHHVLCPNCDLLVALPPLTPGQKGICPRCRNTLQSYWHDPKRQPVRFAISALVMQGLDNFFPFVNMEISGIKRQITLPQIPLVMVSDHFSSLACVFFAVRAGYPRALHDNDHLIVPRCTAAVSPEGFPGQVIIRPAQLGHGGYFLGWGAGQLCQIDGLRSDRHRQQFYSFLFLQLRALQCVDPRWLWNVIMPFTSPVTRLRPGEGGLVLGIRACSCCTLILPADAAVCPRGRTREHARRIHSLQWTLALLLTSLMLYVPATLLPIMITDGLGNRLNFTIMAGVILLWEDGSIPVALVIFIASIMVPSLKMITLGWLCWDAAERGKRNAADSERMHLLYEVVEFVGRWSMIDVFVIAVLSGLVRMGRLMSIRPGICVLLFAAVVILTMIAAKTFDPRLLWDRASHTTLKESTVDGKSLSGSPGGEDQTLGAGVIVPIGAWTAFFKTDVVFMLPDGVHSLG